MAKKKQKKNDYRVARRIERDIEMMQTMRQTLTELPNIFERYDPPPRVWELAEVMLATGESDPDYLQNLLAMEDEEYRKIMRQPKNVAWIAAVLRNHIPFMLGKLDIVMYNKAQQGSVAAYKAVLDRFNEGGVKRSMVAHVNAGTDVSRMTVDQLENMVKAKNREQFGEERSPRDETESTGGAGEA